MVPEWQFPGRGRVQEQLKRAKTHRRAHREGAAGAAAARQAGRAGRPSWRRRRTRSSGRYEYVRALRPLHRVRGDLPGRQPDGACGTRSTPDDQADVQLRPARRRLAARTSAPSTCRRSCTTSRARRRRARTRSTAPDRLRKSGALPRAPRRRVRPREHAHRQQRGRELLVARHPPAEHARAHPLRAAHAAPRRPSLLGASTARTAATSCASSTAATRTPRSTRSTRTPRSCWRSSSSPRASPPAIRRVREHRALGHRTMLITGALDFAVEGLRPLFDEIVAAEMTRAAPTAPTAAS